ncbi:MAG: phosphatase PAP2 family protein [Nitrospirae bacterium]|nr:phosphatase PAP2 family protein [Nitrospirota bacterium]
MDTSLFIFINQGLQNGVFDVVMPFMTHRGYLLFIAIAVPIFFKDRRNGILITTLSILGFIIADHSGDILKHLIARPRPCHELENARLLVTCGKSFSLPSNHAATSFAVASIIGHLFRRGAIPAFVVAFIVAFSRIYVGVHYPSDVIAGAVLGGATGGIILFIHDQLSRRLKK